jgi:hypothetical protein
MQIKLRQSTPDGIVKLETSGGVKEILINEDILHTEKESISICFRGEASSGIVDLTPAEIEKLYDAVQSRIHLIKGFKMLSGNAAKLL